MERKNFKYVVGIDEVGRGPLAGPVTVGIVVAPIDFDRKIFKGIKDSKKLSSKKREYWFEIINNLSRQGFLSYDVSFSSSLVIDKEGISEAIRISIAKSLKNLNVEPDKSLILLDGGLKAPNIFVNQKTIIKGDEKEIIIGAASIMAKVKRDRKMNYYSIKHSSYYFHKNKGYGTKEHISSIIKFGPSKIHRLSFLRKILKPLKP